MNLRRVFPKLRLLSILCGLAFFSACHSANVGPQGNGEGILGRNAIATRDNSSIQCTHVTLAPNLYEVTCFTVVFDGFGQVEASGYATNLTPQWNILSQTAGALASVSCVNAPDLRSTTCTVRTTNSLPTTFVATLNLVETATGATTPLNAEITVPFTAQLVGKIPNHFNLIIGADSNGAASGGRAVAPTTNEIERIGIQMEEIPKAGTTATFATDGRVIGNSLFFSNREEIFKFELSEKSWRSYARLAQATSVDTATPIVPWNSNRYRLHASSMGTVTADQSGVYLFESNETSQRIVHIPNGEAPRTVAQVARNSSSHYPLGGGDAQWIFKETSGGFFVVTAGQVFHLSKEGVATHLAGSLNPVVESTDPTTWQLGIVDVAVHPDGVVLVDDFEKKVVFIGKGSSKVLLRKADIEDGGTWQGGGLGHPTVAANESGVIYMLFDGNSAAHLYRFEGLEKKNTFDSIFTMSGLPSVGSQTPLAQFPIRTPGVFLAGADQNGPIFMSPVGAGHLNVATGLVETLFTTVAAFPEGFSGTSAKDASISPLSSTTFRENGDLEGFDTAMRNLVRINIEKDTIESVRLTGVALTGAALHLFYSPQGGRFGMIQATTPRLYSISDLGVMTLLATLPTQTVGTWTAITAKSNTEFIFNSGGFLKSIDTTTGVVSTLFALPTQYRSLYPTSLSSVGPDGAAYLTKHGIPARVFPLDSSATITPVFTGSATPYAGGLTHEVSNPGSISHIRPFEGGLLMSGDSRAVLVKFTGTAADGSPVGTFHPLYSDTPNPDCAVNFTRQITANSNHHLQATLHSVCRATINGLAARVENGSAFFVLSRTIANLSSNLFLGMPF